MSPSPSDSGWLYSAALFVYSSTVVRFVTVTCLLIGSVSILPLVIFLTIDIILWCWRMAWHRSPDGHGQPKDTQTKPTAPTVTSISASDTSGAQATRRR